MSVLHTDEIDDILYRHPATKPIFKGTFAADQLPKKLNKPFAVVINYDDAALTGSHWVCVYADKDNVHYHDSFGLPPFRLEIPMFLDPDNYTVTLKQLQNKRSTVCGHHVVSFIVCRALGESVESYLSHFGDDTKHNDKVVFDYVSGIKNELFYRSMSNLEVNALVIEHSPKGELFIRVQESFIVIRLFGLPGDERFVCHPSESVKGVKTYRIHSNFYFLIKTAENYTHNIRRNGWSVVVEICDGGK